MATSRNNRMGRPPARERKSERLPPIYVTPTLAATVANKQAEQGIDWAEFGREALEFYVEHGGAAPPGDAITVTADQLVIDIPGPEQERLMALCRIFGYRQLSHFIEDLALRSLGK